MAAIAVLISSSVPIVASRLGTAFSVDDLSGAAFFIAWAALVSSRPRAVWRSLSSLDRAAVVTSILVGLGAYLHLYLYFFSLQGTAGVPTIAVGHLWPILFLLLAAVIAAGRDVRLSRLEWIAVLIATCGAFAVFGGAAITYRRVARVDSVWALASALLMAAYFALVIRRVERGGRFEPTTLLARELTVSLLPLAAILLIFQRLPSASSALDVSLLWLGVAVVACGHAAWLATIREFRGSGRPALVASAYLSVPLAALWLVVLDGWETSATMGLGVLLVMWSLFHLTTRRRYPTSVSASFGIVPVLGVLFSEFRPTPNLDIWQFSLAASLSLAGLFVIACEFRLPPRRKENSEKLQNLAVACQRLFEASETERQEMAVKDFARCITGACFQRGRNLERACERAEGLLLSLGVVERRGDMDALRAVVGREWLAVKSILIARRRRSGLWPPALAIGLVAAMFHCRDGSQIQNRCTFGASLALLSLVMSYLDSLLWNQDRDFGTVMNAQLVTSQLGLKPFVPKAILLSRSFPAPVVATTVEYMHEGSLKAKELKPQRRSILVLRVVIWFAAVITMIDLAEEPIF